MATPTSERLSTQHSALSPDTVYVVGHQNPDTDSICSAIAYAELRRATDLPGATPARLGPPNTETAYALERCGVPAPVLLGDVRQRVADAMNPDVITVERDATLYEAGRLMREGRKRLLPVVDGAGRLCGQLTIDELARRYLEEMALEPAQSVPVSFERYLRALGGRLLAGEPSRRFSGRIWVGSVRVPTLMARLQPGDLVIVGDREEAQEAALGAGVACLIVTGDRPVADRIVALARERGTLLIGSPHNTYATARLLGLSLPVAEIMSAPGRTVDPEDLAADVGGALLGPGVRALPVTDEDGHVRGILSRSDLLRGRRKRVILVDHNHRSQAVAGLEEAELLGVIDHHNLGDLRTVEPILFVLEPVGCTATIVAEHYHAAGLTPTRPVAGLLLAAIISDTLLLTSPTTTPRDRAAVEALGPLAGLDPEAFAQELFRARSDFSALTPRQVIESNLKTYGFGDATLAIGQAETLATDYFTEHKVEFVAELARLKEEGGYGYALFLATDILRGYSVTLYPGPAERRLLSGAFGLQSAGPDSAELPGVVSRKKQVVPPLARALS